MREVLCIDFVEDPPFSDISQEDCAFDDVFHGEPSSSQCSFYVQHYLLSFRANATWHKLTVLILSNLTCKEQQVSDTCRLGKWITHACKWPVIKPLDLCRMNTRYADN